LSGVRAKSPNRIQFDFEYKGVRYRPTLERKSTEANLRRAQKQLEEIKKRIDDGSFSFEEEFPDYRYKAALPTTSEGKKDKKTETCNEVFDRYFTHSPSPRQWSKRR